MSMLFRDRYMRSIESSMENIPSGRDEVSKEKDDGLAGLEKTVNWHQQPSRLNLNIAIKSATTRTFTSITISRGQLGNAHVSYCQARNTNPMSGPAEITERKPEMFDGPMDELGLFDLRRVARGLRDAAVTIAESAQAPA